MEADTQSLEMQAGPSGVSVKGTGRDLHFLLSIAIFAMVAVLIVAMWFHMADATEGRKEFSAALKEQTAAMKDSTQVQREQNCLQTYQGPQDNKGAFCRQVTR